MKLNPHQIEILDKIISGSVYDIPTYLSTFNRAKYHQHDVSAIKATFDAEEDGKTYFFKENDDGSFFTEIYDKEGNVTSVAPVLNQMTSYLKEYPNSSPVEAELDMFVAPIKVDFQGNSYSFDFLNDKCLVANNFEEIIDFLVLWAYLKREALIIEFNKPISEEEISIFFEPMKSDVHPDNLPKWDLKLTSDRGKRSARGLPVLSSKQIPKKKTQGYITDSWSMNYEHLTMCTEYIGKKILPTSSLQMYKQNKYRTFEEVSQFKNLIVAWVAVFISVVSVIIGNVLPLFDNQESEYLASINQHIATIESRLENDTSKDEILTEISEVKKAVSDLASLSATNNDKQHSELIETIETKIDELIRFLDTDNTAEP
ncbi:MAG: hypothetical protein IKI93_04720 [Clostridia bacterium]|nr:hypothetical protein [Clostridia bacterium]